MTNSIKAFEYVSDRGVKYGVRLDESSSEATAAPGGKLFDDFVDGTPRLPCGLRMRYVNCVLSTDANIRKQLKVGTTSVYNTIAGGTRITEAGVGGGAAKVWSVLSKRGEKENLLSSKDTAQIDEDDD
jgi:hypothetical protein